jgi:hypothetical protein
VAGVYITGGKSRRGGARGITREVGLES